MKLNEHSIPICKLYIFLGMSIGMDTGQEGLKYVEQNTANILKNVEN